MVACAFPKYAGAVPLVRVLLLALICNPAAILYMVTVLDGYLIQLIAAPLGLGVFIGIVLLLRLHGYHTLAVVWGSLAGQVTFTLACLVWLYRKVKLEGKLSTARQQA